MGAMVVTEDYFKTLGINMKEGRHLPDSQIQSYYIQRNAIRRLRYQAAMNRDLNAYGKQRFKIIGIAKDALMHRLSLRRSNRFFWQSLSAGPHDV